MTVNPFVSHPDLVKGAGIVESQPEPEPTPAPAPDPNDIATQKYGDDVTAVKRGYNEQFLETQRIIAASKADQDKLRLYEQALIERSSQPAVPTKAPEDELRELGIPVDAVDRLVDRIVDRRLEPLNKALRAQAEIAAELPELVQSWPTINRFLATNPALNAEYSEMAAVNPKAAARYAHGMWKASGTPRTSAASEGLDRTSALPPSSQPPANRGAPERNWEKELSEAKAYAEQTGDDKPYWKIWHTWNRDGKPLHPDA